MPVAEISQLITIASAPKQTWQHLWQTTLFSPRQNSWRRVPPNASNLSATVFLCLETWMGGKKIHRITATMLSPFSVAPNIDLTYGSARFVAGLRMSLVKRETNLRVWHCGWLRITCAWLFCMAIGEDVLTFFYLIQPMPFLLLFVAKWKVNNWWSGLWKALIEQGHG